MGDEKVPVYISKELHNLISCRIRQSQGEFKSVQEYIEFVLNEILREEKIEEAYTPEEEEEIKKRLKKLGYL